jgi:hypothetical protein
MLADLFLQGYAYLETIYSGRQQTMFVLTRDPDAVKP